LKDFNWIKAGFITASLLAAFWVLAAWLYPVSANHYNPSKAHSSQEISSEAFVPPPEIHPKYKTARKYSDKEIEQWRADRSDLAAQWKAADMSQLAFRIGVLGVILLTWTIYQTLDAGAELRSQNTIARDTLKVAQQTLATERAWVLIDSVENNQFENPKTKDKITVMKVKVINFGNHPASDVTVYRDFLLYRASVDFPVFEGRETRKSSAIIPQGKIIYGNDIVLDKKAVNILRSGEFYIAVFARVTYFDGYSDTVRTSEAAFRGIYTGEVHKDGGIMPNFAFEPAGEQNQAT